jgi:transposase
MSWASLLRLKEDQRLKMLVPEEVAILIRSRQILKDKGLPRDADVTTVCREAGISRKTGYQWANKFGNPCGVQADAVGQEHDRLKAEHAKLKKDYEDVCIENEGRRLAWEIHGVDDLIAKKNYGQAEKEKVVRFLRAKDWPLRKISWVLALCIGTLSNWDQAFDETMKPLVVPDKRGKTGKVTVEIVKDIVAEAKKWKDRGNRIRIKEFTKSLKEKAIVLSSKTVQEILIANDLFASRTKKRRPQYYQSICQRIPNGLLSMDGSEFTIWLDDQAIKFNVELGVDVGSFCHTAFSVADTETTEEVIKVLETHCRQWGSPIGVLCDHDSANLSADSKAYIKARGIELVPAGPSNPKGNGTLEGAFSQMKEVIGPIRLDLSSPRALAKSVLELVVSVYIKMRNKLTLRGKSATPIEELSKPVPEGLAAIERQRLKDHNAAKTISTDHQPKLDRLHWVIKNHGIETDSRSLDRAEKSIKAYELEAIADSEKAFIRAVTRKPELANLPYFFGILKRIQQDRDDEQELQEQSQGPTVKDIIGMLENAVSAPSRFLKERAARMAQRWTEELKKSYKNLGSLKKQLASAVGNLNHLSLEQKENIWKLVEQCVNPKSTTESVTLTS